MLLVDLENGSFNWVRFGTISGLCSVGSVRFGGVYLVRSQFGFVLF